MDIKREEKDTVSLIKGRDRTYPKFLEWLNATFKKTTGQPFTAQDVYGYIKRGNLPSHCGVYKLDELIFPEIGLKIVRTTDLNR